MSTSRLAPPARVPFSLWIVLFLLALSVFINYIDRGNLSIAAPLLKDELNLSPTKLGGLLSAFFWTYACMQLISGWLVDRVNVNWVMAGGFFLWSMATALTGFVHLFATLLVLRLLLGIGESVAFPSCSKIIALNFPEEHLGLANSFISVGIVLGPGFGMLFGGTLMDRFGWRPFFIVLGFASLLWLVPWILFMPRKHHAHVPDSVGAPRLLEFVRLRSAWGTCIALFCGNYVNYFLITWLPFYLVKERHFSMTTMARIGGLAYLLGALNALLCGWLSDRWIAAGHSPTLVRKSFVGGGIALSGIFIGLAIFGGPASCIAALILGVFFFGASASNLYAITQTLAGPKAAGRWTGLQNFIGNLAGVVAPAVTGFVLARTGQFYWAFVILTIISLAGLATWIFIVGRIEPVIWDHHLRATSHSLPVPILSSNSLDS